MKHWKLRFTISIILSALIIAGLTCTVVFVYKFHLDFKAMWISIVLSIFFIDAVFSLIIFNSKLCSDEIKAFWLFIILLLPPCGFIFWLLIGIKRQSGFDKANSVHVKLLSRIFNAKKSIKIYTNSIFLSNDVIKALNYAAWKKVNVTIVLSINKKTWKQNLSKFDINKFYDPVIDVCFTDKEIDKSFMILDDSTVLLSTTNFNYKYMHSRQKFDIDDSATMYLNTWKKDFLRSSMFKHTQSKPIWTARLKYGIVNIFYPFF